MPNDIVPQPTLVEQVLGRINLPEILGGAAGKAIFRLIGEVVDIPSVWIGRYTQGVKDGTEARSIISRALAQEGAKSIALDKDLVERATEVMLAKEVRKQANREGVARKALEHLTDEEIRDSKEEIDEDWMNMFSQHAENASSERLQEIWGRVLGGEIRKRGSFSLKTLRFISELDQSIAKLFESHAEFVVGQDFLIADRKLSGAPFSALLQLQDFGLIIGVGQNLTKTFNIVGGMTAVSYQNGVFIIRAKDTQKVVFPAHILTRVGVEIASILRPSFSLDHAKTIVGLMPKQGLAEILLHMPILGQQVLPPIMMWKKED